VTLPATLCLFPLTYACGALSDRLGRRPVVMAGLFLGAVSILPVYFGLRQFAATPWLLFVLLLVPVLALALVTGPQTALLSELFTARTRYTAVGLPHNLAAGWIGGLSPFFVTLIADRSGSALTGLFYPAALLVIALVTACLFLPETRAVDLGR
jgi:MFS family permease